jgi:hypothetical protein
MNDAEGRIRAATRAVAGTVHQVRPLELPPGDAAEVPGTAGVLRKAWVAWVVGTAGATAAAGPAERLERSATPRRGPRAGRTGRLRAWGVPLAAAAAMLAIAASVLAVRDLPGGRPAVVPGSSSSALPSSTWPATHAVRPVPGVPEYYVTLDNASINALNDTYRDSSPFQAVVGGTFSGARLATVNPPAGSTFAGVTAAADDRTFVLDATPCSRPDAASQVCARTWYLLRIAPGTSTPAHLTRLPIPATTAGTRVEAMALSPDGRELAVALQPDANGPGQAPESLVLYSVATGAVLRTWTGPNGTILTPGEWFRVDSLPATLSWLADGHTLVFSDETAVRTLDTTRPGQDLISDSDLVWSPNQLSGHPPGYQLSCGGGENVIDGGATLVCGATGMPTPARHLTSQCSDMWDNAMGFLEYSTATRRLTRTLYLDQTTCTSEVTAELYWASPSGGPLIVLLNSAPEKDPAGPQWNEVGVLANGRVSPLSFPVDSGAPMLGGTAW